MSDTDKNVGGEPRTPEPCAKREDNSKRYNEFASVSQAEANELEISISKHLIGICGVFLPLLALSLQSNSLVSNDKAAFVMLASGASLFLSAAAGLVHFFISRGHVMSYMDSYQELSDIAEILDRNQAPPQAFLDIRDMKMRMLHRDSKMWALVAQVIFFLLGSLGMIASVAAARFYG